MIKDVVRELNKLNQDIGKSYADHYGGNIMHNKIYMYLAYRQIENFRGFYKENKSDILKNSKDMKIKDVYPSPFDKLLSVKGIKKMDKWLKDINREIAGKKGGQYGGMSKSKASNNDIMAIMLLLLWYTLVRNLLKPALYLLAVDGLNKGTDFRHLGIEKPMLNKVKIVMDIYNTDVVDFLKYGDVSDEEVGKMDKLLKRIGRSMVATKSGFFERLKRRVK